MILFVLDFRSFEFINIVSLAAMSETLVGYRSDTPSSQCESSVGCKLNLTCNRYGMSNLPDTIPIFGVSDKRAWAFSPQTCSAKMGVWLK